MRRHVLLLIIAVCVAQASSRGSAAPPEDATLRIADTQLTLRVERARGRATVIRITGNRLTVVTAAHFLSAKDVDTDIVIQRGEEILTGRVLTVAQNPNFHWARSKNPNDLTAGSTLGVDTAVATINVEPHNEAERRLFESIRAADMTIAPFPGVAGQIVPVHIVDQFEKEHVVRAGNHLNPKCLAWGRSTYDPQHGDSGAGVFVLRRSQAGTLSPVLIGNVSQSDGRGGIASLAHRSDPWIRDALGLKPAANGHALQGESPLRR